MKTAVANVPVVSTNADLKTRILQGKVDGEMNFHQKVWALTARIPRGRVTTYAMIARALDTKAYRAVGQALHHNPYAPQVPCHRVVGSTGNLTGFAQGIDAKVALLEKEGVKVQSARVDLKQAQPFDVSQGR